MKSINRIAQAAIVVALFVLAGAQALAQEEEQTPVCFDVNSDVDVEENVCFPRIDGYSLRTAFLEWPQEVGWNPVWYGGTERMANAYYGAADPEDQLESRVLVVRVSATALLPLHTETRNPRSWGRWGYESGIEVSAYLMTAAHDDPNQQGGGRTHAYDRVVLKDNGNLAIEDCRFGEHEQWWPTSVRFTPATDWQIKVNRMIRRYLEREDAPAICSVESGRCDPRLPDC